MENKNNGKLTVALLAGVALGGWISSLFSSKKLLKDGIEPNNGLKKRLLKDSYTEMSNKLAS